MVRRRVLADLGGFDESFHPAWFEDVDLCRRIRDAGGRIVYEPSAEFLHHGGASLKHLARERFLQYYHGNQLRYFLKHHGPGDEARVRRLVWWGMLLRAGVSLLRPVVPNASRAASARTFWRTAQHFRLAGRPA
jgi:GT2 family glycosyltransferase